MDAVSADAGTGRDAAPRASQLRKLLVLETNFTLEAVRERQVEDSITCRDLGGFFEHVWSVHPFATLSTTPGWSLRYGAPTIYQLAPRHTFIEAKVGRFTWCRRVFALNFILSQIDLFFRLRRLIRREGISVIRVSSPLYEGIFGLALARLTKIPLLVRVGANHDKTFETTGRPMEPRLMRSRKIEKVVERYVFRRADLVAGANQDNLNFALANGAAADRSTLFRYGNLIDKRHLVAPAKRQSATVLTQLGVKPGMFLLYVGRFDPVKQPNHVLEVLSIVRRAGHDVKAVLAGDGSMRASLIAQSRELGIENAVLMPGNLNQDALAQLYPRAAAVISPHTGRALTEAALGAAPVVAYDIDWQRELIETDQTGYLVEYDDVRAMGQATLSLLQNRRRAHKLGAALRLRALKMLNPQALDEHERSEYLRLFARFDGGKTRRLDSEPLIR